MGTGGATRGIHSVARPATASDLFSLDATLFAAVEGTSPIGAGDPFSTLVAVAPATCARSLAKDPTDRLTVEQLQGQVLGRAGDAQVELGPGDLVAVPPQRHNVDALEPSVLLLTQLLSGACA
ncbi:hypothetical protein [Kribbella steppae]|uniref:hypothetical protein n=1 Tax=Kribbella steppae TaxID=2512223 RepID=UPI0010455566|nr:hypothetical protein [Kribbella steppae]